MELDECGRATAGHRHEYQDIQKGEAMKGRRNVPVPPAGSATPNPYIHEQVYESVADPSSYGNI